MRFFNTSGPVRSDMHYCVPPLTRLKLDEILLLIDQQRYFVLHAPRQVGKTSYLLALQEYLNHSKRYRALYINVEGAQAARENVPAGITAILSELALRASTTLRDTFLLEQHRSILEQFGAYTALNSALTLWAEQSPQPLVLLVDEIDSLVGDTLISILRQLRSGYDKRPAFFPQSVLLCGVRDVRDYRIYSDEGKTSISGGSAFNIKAESLLMGDFTRTEMESLYAQHTTETGQHFETVAVDLLWELTQGQPWLVNALGNELCFKLAAGRDREKSITASLVMVAKERLILRRETHLDQLIDKLREERVRRVIQPMLLGGDLEGAATDDDLQYVMDLGLVRRTAHGPQIANPIYLEVIPRQLNHITQANLESQIVAAWYVGADGRLEMDKLLTAFQQFFREHSEHWVERFDYKEAGPQLLMQAFLQRVVNGGGRIEREYGLGRGRTDLLVIWPHPVGVQRIVIELKLLYRSLAETIQAGLAQTIAYMERCNTADGHLIIFDRRAEKPWSEKIFTRTEQQANRTVTVWGM